MYYKKDLQQNNSKSISKRINNFSIGFEIVERKQLAAVNERL